MCQTPGNQEKVTYILPLPSHKPDPTGQEPKRKKAKKQTNKQKLS